MESRAKRLIAPGLLALSAAALLCLQPTGAQGEAQPALDCPNAQRVLIEPLYATASIAGDDGVIEVTDAVLNGPSIPGSTQTREVDTVAQSQAEAMTSVSEANGDVIALLRLEGSDDEGWRISEVEECAS